MAAVGLVDAASSLADDQHDPATLVPMDRDTFREELLESCLLYTSDAADE